MILSTMHGSIANAFGDEEAIKIIKRAGFDGIDFSFGGTVYGPIYYDDYKTQAKHIRKVLDEENMVCVQAHAPFCLTYKDERVKENDHFLEIIRSLEMCKTLGTDKCVVHALIPPPNVDYYSYNLDYYGELTKYAKKYGVKILVENLWLEKEKPTDKYYPPIFKTANEMMKFIKELNSPYIKTVFDVGHAQLVGTNPAEYIRGLDNETLIALHVHDNCGDYDAHFAPYEGIINFDDVLKALADIEYKGDMNLELEYSRKRPKELIFATLKYREQVGRHLIEEFNKHVIKNLQEKIRLEKEKQAQTKNK